MILVQFVVGLVPNNMPAAELNRGQLIKNQRSFYLSEY